METFKTFAACAVITSITAPALAESPERKPPVGPLERRLIIPDLVGLQVGSLATTNVTAGLSGLVSYSYIDASTPSGGAHAESFGVNPSFDVRAGRFTIGGTTRFTHLYSRLDTGQGSFRSNSLSFQAIPRVGMLFPLAPHITLWPRVGAGIVAAKSDLESQTSTSVGFVGVVDALVVVDLGSRFFVSAGPEVRFGYVVGQMPFGAEQHDASFHAGASVAMGVAF